MLTFTRSLLALRRELADLAAPRRVTASSSSAGGVWAWRRGDAVVVALNLADQRRDGGLDGDAATVRFGTRTERSGERSTSAIALGPWEGVVADARRRRHVTRRRWRQSSSRNTGWSGAIRWRSASGESAPTPSKKTPTSAFHRFR